MNLQFLSIGNRNGVEVAYFLDRQTNIVYAFRVVDATGAPPAPPQTFTIPAPTGGPVPAPMVFDAPPAPHPELPDKPRSIVPPGMAALMRPGNETSIP